MSLVPLLAADAASGFNWATVVASVGGSSIAGAAALCGVLITRRTERRKAHEDRIWEARVASYRPIFIWAHEWWNIYSGDGNRPRPPRFTPDAYYNIEIHGSDAVVEAFESAAAALSPDLGRSVAEIAADPDAGVRSALQLLIDRIQAETRGKRRPTTGAAAARDHRTATVPP